MVFEALAMKLVLSNMICDWENSSFYCVCTHGTHDTLTEPVIKFNMNGTCIFKINDHNFF